MKNQYCLKRFIDLAEMINTLNREELEFILILPDNLAPEGLFVLCKTQIREKRDTTKDKQITHLKALLKKAHDIINNNEIKSREQNCTFNDAVNLLNEIKRVLN